MDELGRIQTFIDVVEAGSFSRAARGTSISAITRRVQSLEAELDVRLLNRTTRGLALTDAGREFYERSKAIAVELGSAISDVRALQTEVKGSLRVSLRPAIAMTMVAPALPGLFARYPDLKLEIQLSDQKNDLLASNVDIAVWLGELPDSVTARKLSSNRRVVCATPAYLDIHGTPQKPRDLLDHNCLLFTPTFAKGWRFARDGTEEEVEVGGNLRSDNAPFLLTSALADSGLIVVFEWMVRDLVANGQLRTVLNDYSVNPHSGAADMYAVWPSSRGMSRKLRVFVDFLVEQFAEPRRERDRSGPADSFLDVSTQGG